MRLLVRQFPEALRQVASCWSCRAADQHRNNPHCIALEAGFHFDANEIVRVVEAAVALAIGGIQPAWPDNDQHHMARGYRLLDCASEISAGRDVIYILKNVLLTECGSEVVKDAPGNGPAVVAPVGNKDARHSELFRNHAVKKGSLPNTLIIL